MKLLVVTSSYPRHADDIAGRFVLEWVEHLEALGHSVRVCTWSDSSVDGPPLHTAHSVTRVRYAPPGLQTLFYGAGTPENLRQNPARAILGVPAAAAMAAYICAEVASWRPDVIVGHWLVPAGLLVRALGHLLGVPTLVVGHSGGVHLLESLPRPAGRALAAAVAAGPTTVPSLALAEKLGRLAPAASLEILPMGYEAPRVDRRADAERVDWLCMGRLVEIKGVDLAIEAFARAELAADATLHVAGDGPRRGELERLAGRLGARVRFHGFVTGKGKRRLWGRCVGAIFCSKTLASGRHEGLPVSFLEASAHGVIPLCSPIPGLAHYLADATLQEIESRAPHRWARGIEALADLPDEQRARLVRHQRRTTAELEWPRLIKRWDSQLQRLRY